MVRDEPEAGDEDREREVISRARLKAGLRKALKRAAPSTWFTHLHGREDVDVGPADGDWFRRWIRKCLRKGRRTTVGPGIGFEKEYKLGIDKRGTLHRDRRRSPEEEE